MKEKEGRQLENIVIHKTCPLFKTKCKRDECVFYEEKFDWNYTYVGEKILNEVAIGNKKEITFSAKERLVGARGICSLKDCVAVQILHIYVPKLGETFTRTECYDIETKTKPWWRFW